MAQIQVQKALEQEEKALQGPSYQPPPSTKPSSPPPPSLPPRPFVSGGVKERIETSVATGTGVAMVFVGGDASEGGEGRTRRVPSLNIVSMSQLPSEENTNSTWDNSSSTNTSNNRPSVESSSVHVECSVIPEVVTGKARGMTMPMMNEEKEGSYLTKMMLPSRSAVVMTTTAPKVTSRAMRRRRRDLHLHDICWTLSHSNKQRQHRVSVEQRHASGGRTKNGWRSIWALLVLASFVSAAVAGGLKGHARLENPDGVAYDPLQPSIDQLMLPVVAGVPPLSPANSNNSPNTFSKEQQEYRNRLEMERLEREGSFYVELTPLERQQAIAAAASGAAGSIRFLKEPLPWEGLGDEDMVGEDQDGLDRNGIDSEEENYLGWSYSPWGGEFRYEISSDGDGEDKGYVGYDDGEDEFYYEEEAVGEGRQRGPRHKLPGTVSQHQQRQQQGQHQRDQFSAMAAVDNDDGSSVVDEDYTRLELTTRPFQEDSTIAQAKEVTKMLKMEESGKSGESVTNRDPNVIDNIKEAAEDSQVWDAEGAAQEKASAGHKSNTQEYAETPLSEPADTMTQKEKETVNTSGGGGRSFAAEPKPRGPDTTLDGSMEAEVETVRPKLDQIDLLGHEAEVEWLQEQDEIQSAWRRKHHHLYKDEDRDEEEDYDDDAHEGYARVEVVNEQDVNEEKKGQVQESTLSSELPLDGPDWRKEHGGLNPKHTRIYKSQHSRPDNINRFDKSQDIDEDGTVFPNPYSKEPYSAIVYPSNTRDPFSSLGYVAYNTQGDRIIDFSMVGWNEGNTDLPDAIKEVPVMERLFPRDGADKDTDKGDDTDRIQNALDRIGQRTKGRVVQGKTVVPTGALALGRGVYRISKPLRIRDSGILFRGDPAGGSRIVCQWEPTGPRYAVEIEGQTDKMLPETRVPVVSDYTPVGSFFLALDPTYLPESTLAIGDQIMVTRTGNSRWIEDIGMDDFDSSKKGVKPWKKMRAHMFRTVRSLDTHTGIIQLDAPLPISIGRHYGGGWVTKYEDYKIRAVGVQFLDMVFPRNVGRTTDDMLDEKGRGSEDYLFSYEIFANYAFRLDQAAHVYFSHITTSFFHNFISIGADVHHVTLDSVVHSYPDDMLSGQSAFQLSGQLVLIKNSLSQGSFHFFVDIKHVPGPNVVHRAQAINIGKPHQPLPLDFAPGEVGPHMKFCTGLLFDQVVTDGSIQIVNRGYMGTGQGYAGANSVIWNSRAREGVLTHRAKGFQNFVIGSEDFEAKDRHPWDSQGWKEHLGSEVLPGSLYLRQLGDRLNRMKKGWLS